MPFEGDGLSESFDEGLLETDLPGCHVGDLKSGRIPPDRMKPQSPTGKWFVIPGMRVDPEIDRLIDEVLSAVSAPELLVREVLDALRTRFDVTEEEADHSPERLSFKLPRELVA